MKPAQEPIEVNLEELAALVERAHQGQPLSAADCQRLEAAVQALSYLIERIGEKNTTISQLRTLLTKPSTEKTSKVLEQAGIQAPARNSSPVHANENKQSKPGHGRNGAQAYRGAERIKIVHGSLKSGEPCPGCLKGKVYLQKDPGLRIRVVGQTPIAAKIYELERLRCNLCGEVYEAQAPPEVGEKKYDPSAAAMIAQLKYGSGVPWDRLERLEANLGIPLPASTQCEIVAEVAEAMRPAGEELIRQAAQGEVFYNDDTSMKILGLARASPHPKESEEEVSNARSPRSQRGERTGLFTSGIVSTTRQGQRIALFFTGRNHAGENLARVFMERAKGLSPPIQMSDALSRNVPKLERKLEILWGNCNAHARRRFVEVTANFPEECRFVLESFREVYRYEAESKRQGLSPEARLRFHQEHSQPVMDALHAWFLAQFAEKRVEPNSGLGEAISYCLKRWERLTLFLTQPGAPLDSNLVERALKKCILHRKNSLFYKTANGAAMGDLFMSLIHTCELNGVNSFEYLIALQKHAAELAKNSAAWMPWNYRDTLVQSGTGGDPR